MPIFTSSWFTKLPPDMVRIGISRGVPRGMAGGYRMLKKLAPGGWFHSVDVEEYKRRYFDDLAKLNPQDVIDVIDKVTDGRDCALLCFEAPRKMEDWCHRGYVSAWLHDELGIEIFEYGMVDHRCGWMHPKLPNRFRTAPPPVPIDVTPYVGRKGHQGNKIWTVIGQNPEHPDQALIESDGEQASISEDVLKTRFGGLL